jgi:hypothetical protein
MPIDCTGWYDWRWHQASLDGAAAAALLSLLLALSLLL